jgi:hypothetical protein
VDLGYVYANDSPLSRADPTGLWEAILYVDSHKIQTGYEGAFPGFLIGTGCALMILGGISAPLGVACGIIAGAVGIQKTTYGYFVLTGVETDRALVLIGMECLLDGWGDKVCQLESYVVWAKNGQWASLDRLILYSLRQAWRGVWQLPGATWGNMPGARFVGSGTNGPAAWIVCRLLTTGICS